MRWKMLEQIYNLFTGVRYAGVLSCNEKYDLGVSVVKFMSDGRCKAEHIEYRGVHDDESDLRSLSSCFRVPFIPGYTKDNMLLHPLGWRWTLGKKYLTYEKAYNDFKKSVLVDSVIRPNQKLRTLEI
jgi:hypothetical protein